MKRQLIFAAAALALAACSNDENLSNEPTAIRLSSSLSVQETNTRAATDIQGTAFDANQNVDVYINEVVTAGQTVTTTYGTGGLLVYETAENNGMTPPTPQYFPSSGNGVTIYALYPSSSEAFGDGNGYAATESTTTFTVQTDQSGDDKYMLSDLMYGKPSSNPVARTSSPIALSFNHLLSKVTITLKSGDGSPDLDGAVVSLLNVNPTTALSASTTSGSISAATGTNKEITVMTASASSLTGSAIVPPQSFTADSQYIKVKLANGGELFYTLPDAVTLNGGKEYKYEITVNLTELQVTSTIVGWAVETGEGAYTGDDNGSANFSR